MIRSINETTATVPPEEVARRIAEMRQIAWEHRSPAVVVYHAPHHPCPWAGCDLRIAAITFELDKYGRPEQLEAWLRAWWLGPGLAARCPSCGRHVLFDVLDKKAVAEPVAASFSVLPDDWHQHARLATRPEVTARRVS